ncbi:pentapeptide repeat-containing protein [Haliea sp. E1-2-M8]|uniref:pentapeptide repeat-containing protein n=1 Tax=Haliea sp. E1-2-M8 TaxID=3064706 RepID=UPI00351C9270
MGGGGRNSSALAGWLRRAGQADFRGARLRGARLRGARLRGARLRGARLRGGPASSAGCRCSARS